MGVVTTLRQGCLGIRGERRLVRFVPVKETLTEVPALPVFEIKAVIVGAPTPLVLRMMERRFPTASYVYVATLPFPSTTCNSRPKLSQMYWT